LTVAIKSRSGWLFAAGLVTVVGLLLLINWWGRLTGWHFWTWQGWDALVALGTTLLAVTTGLLALTASREMSATRELAELTRADQRSRETPILYAIQIITPSGGHIRSTMSESGGVSSNAFATVARIQNVGLGPAISAELTMTYKGSFTLSTPRTVTEPISTLLHGEIFDLTFWWETTEPAIRDISFRDQDFDLVGECLDTSGGSHQLRHGRVPTNSATAREAIG
jgi:hypothetical protein